MSITLGDAAANTAWGTITLISLAMLIGYDTLVMAMAVYATALLTGSVVFLVSVVRRTLVSLLINQD